MKLINMAMCEIVIKCGLFACIHGHDLFDFYFFQVSDKMFLQTASKEACNPGNLENGPFSFPEPNQAVLLTKHNQTFIENESKHQENKTLK